jgi:putative flippase GtrA
MSGHSLVQRAVWVLGWIERYRYLKFGIVGASGTVVNLTVLYLGHEYLFNAIEASYKRPYLSLALAISAWPRSTTSPGTGCGPGLTAFVFWKRTNQYQPVGLRVVGMEFGQYATASAFGSGLQYVLTLLLTGSMDYRVANIIAIMAASVSNFPGQRPLDLQAPQKGMRPPRSTAARVAAPLPWPWLAPFF